ncbi:uncharacterized protein LOC129611868 [Condylostylus longicornis]|uniref:uncharacterized protein LOC129611868 n=1 Tax=Condylostylus longicornis TaxID=2530218 RepID=UPI00244DD587|nr:uncharacterized protein LOC129611868 [Condylostylus longicornis]
MNLWIYVYLTALLGCCYVSPLSVTHIDVPEIVDFRDRVTLSCSFNMGGHKLNSVKWYKDEEEFFRYSPMTHPIFLTFPVDGVTTSKEGIFCNELTCSINLSQLKRKSSGTYRCEVSGDAPEFKLATKASNMTVAALPQHDPLISGVSIQYEVDQYVIANCTSDYSSPPATLSWYINNERVFPEWMQPQQESSMEMNEFLMKSRSLVLNFYLNSQIFYHSDGILELKCVAEIDENMRRERIAASYLLPQNDYLNNQKLYYNNNLGNRRKMLSFISLAIIGLIFNGISDWFLKVNSIDFLS